MERIIKIVKFYNHAPEKVWHAITDPNSIEKWLIAENRKHTQYALVILEIHAQLTHLNFLLVLAHTF